MKPDAHRLTGWLILILLLILRIPYTIAIIYLLPIENQNGAAVYEIATYLLLAFLIWWERHSLVDFHMDIFAIVFILLLRPVQTLVAGYWDVNSPLAFPNLPALSLWMIAVGLLVALLKSGYKPPRIHLPIIGWLTIGLLLGLSFSVLQNLSIVLPALFLSTGQTSSVALLKSSGLTVLYHTGFAPINEEPLFRGFLWGYLRQLRWRESSICLFQTFLFMLAHIYRASPDPLLFWVIIPLVGLLLGILTWRSRSIAPSILAHGSINGSAYVFMLLVIGLF